MADKNLMYRKTMLKSIYRSSKVFDDVMDYEKYKLAILNHTEEKHKYFHYLKGLYKCHQFLLNTSIEGYNPLVLNILYSLIFNKNSHLVSTFKDSMIWDYIDEFLKRYYNKPESFDRVPRFASFYKNYLKFFCKPIFINFSANSVLQDYNEKKAELYYNQNFISGNENGDDGNDAIDDDGEDESESKKSKSVSKSKIEKTIFDSTIKRNIDNESINTVVNNNENLHLASNI